MKRRVTVAIKNQGREVSKGQLTLVTELVDAEKLTRDEAELIRELLTEQWGPSDLVENPML